MIRAILYKDIISLKQRKIFLMFQFIVIVGVLALVKLSDYGSGVTFLGREFVHLFIISVASLSAFLDLYMNCLVDDCRDNIIPMLFFNKMSLLSYWVGRTLMPFAISMLYGAFALYAYTIFIDPHAVLTGFLLSAGVAMLAEVFFAIGLGTIASLFFDTDITANPNIAIPFMGINGILLYLFNPAYGVLRFILATIIMGSACLLASTVISKIRYRSNITDSPLR